jgi:tetratricopeptide (TPR) repeat protein
MPKLFVSYQHNSADTEAVTWLVDSLTKDGHEVFFDRDIPKARLFDEYIKDRLKDCDAFIIVVSRAAKVSTWVRAELRVADQLSRKNEGRPRIIPLVREEFVDEWPMEWHVILEMIQYVSYLNPDRDRPGALADIKKVLSELGGSSRAAPPGAVPPRNDAGPGRVGLPQAVLVSVHSLLEVAEAQLDRRQFKEALGVLATCEQLADQPEGQAPVATRIRLCNGLALVHASLRALPAALTYALKARNLLADRDDPALKAQTDHRLGYIYLQRGDHFDALKHLEMADSLARDTGATALRGQVQDIMGTAWGLLGLLEVALEHYRLSLELKQVGGDLQGQAITHGNLGRTYQRLGQLSRAQEHFEKDLELSLTLEDQAGVLLMRSQLAGLLREQFRFEESLRAYAAYLQQAQDYRLLRHAVYGQLGLAQVQIALGQYDQVEKQLTEANRGATQVADLALKARVLRAGADLAAARGEPREALNLYRMSLEEMEKGHGIPTELVEVLCQMARVYAREGEKDQVERCLHQAEEAVRANRLRWVRGRVQGLRQRLLSGDQVYQCPEMPFPLAVQAGRVDMTEEAHERLRCLVDLFRGSLKYAATVALAYYRLVRPRIPLGESDAAMVRTFHQKRPSLGVWAEVLRTVLQVLAEHRKLLPEPLVVDVFVKPVRDHSRLRPEIQDRISRLLAIRNNLTHNGWPQDHTEAIRLTDEMAADLLLFLGELRPLWDYRLLACQQCGRTMQWRELRGPGSLVQWQVTERTGPETAVCGSIYLLTPGDSAWLQLTPWWVARWRDDRAARGDLFMFSKRRKSRNVYVNVETSEEYEFHGAAALFEPVAGATPPAESGPAEEVAG